MAYSTDSLIKHIIAEEIQFAYINENIEDTAEQVLRQRESIEQMIEKAGNTNDESSRISMQIKIEDEKQKLSNLEIQLNNERIEASKAQQERLHAQLKMLTSQPRK